MSATAATAREHKRYGKYRATGNRWVDRVPDHWPMRRLKTIATVRLSNVDKKTVEGQLPVRLCNYVDVYRNEHITSQHEFMEATATSEQIAKFGLRRGDVLVTKDSESWNDIAVPAVVAEDLPGVICGYHLAHVRPLPQFSDGKFLARSFAASGVRDQFWVSANGITRYGLNGDAIRSGVFPMPPVEEQHAIAGFLDTKTAEIDVLIEKKERLLQLLAEKGAASVTRVVTMGLVPGVPMRRTPVGTVPSHWELKRLSDLTDERRPIMYGIVLPGPHEPNGVPIVKGGDVAPGRLKLDLLSRTTEEIERGYARSRLRGGDLVFAIRGSIGSVEPVPMELTGCNLTQDAARVSTRRGVDPTWLLFALRSHVSASQVRARTTGATIRGLNIRDLKRIVVPVPPIREQGEIAAHIQTVTTHLGDLTLRVRLAIDCLREYRTALISAAVTGKIDVRSYQTTPCQ